MTICQLLATLTQALCSTSAPIQNGIAAVACACLPIPFDGMWRPNPQNISKFDVDSNGVTQDSCFDLTCSDESSGDLASQSVTCFGNTTLATYQATLTIEVSLQICLNVSMSVVPGRVYSRPTAPPLALSFIKTNYDIILDNAFAVVTNEYGVTVGQIESDMIRVDVQKIWSDVNKATMWPCILHDDGMKGSSKFKVFDLGILLNDGVTIRPLGLTNIVNISDGQKICFSGYDLEEGSISIILIQRTSNYQVKSVNTAGEEGILLTSGVLFSLGAVTVFALHVFMPWKLSSFLSGMQGVVLLLIRGVYCFLLYSGDIPVGSLLDFALIEIPTFVYIGIFVRIITVAYWLFFRIDDLAKRTSDASFFAASDISASAITASIVVAFLLNWMVFAAIVIALAFSDTSSSVTKWCNCQLSDGVTQSDTALIIRLVYKSVVVLFAICVLFLVVKFGRTHVKGRNQGVYYQVVILSVGLFADCVAFLIYYSIRSPSAYFLIVLWFTEILPICIANGMAGRDYVVFWWRNTVGGMVEASFSRDMLQ